MKYYRAPFNEILREACEEEMEDIKNNINNPLYVSCGIAPRYREKAIKKKVWSKEEEKRYQLIFGG